MKKGFTFVSLVLYVMLFFTFTIFTTAISTNLNHQLLSEKGRVIVNESYMKFYTNLINSAKKSISVDIIGNKIVFSNGDIYEYNSANKEIYRNHGNFVYNIESFAVSNLEDILGVSNNINDIDIVKCFSINVAFKKYNEIINKDIVITVGDDLYE
ncbi:MAG: hypothetical protein PHD15_00720 [Clostridia bacterium]|nr:hypothetical protein [Clostridia bacterium]MDD4386273.1 hypothetical protein [Clostridia bacterium]